MQKGPTVYIRRKPIKREKYAHPWDCFAVRRSNFDTTHIKRRLVVVVTDGQMQISDSSNQRGGGRRLLQWSLFKRTKTSRETRDASVSMRKLEQRDELTYWRFISTKDSRPKRPTSPWGKGGVSERTIFLWGLGQERDCTVWRENKMADDGGGDLRKLTS